MKIRLAAVLLVILCSAQPLFAASVTTSKQTQGATGTSSVGGPCKAGLSGKPVGIQSSSSSSLTKSMRGAKNSSSKTAAKVVVKPATLPFTFPLSTDWKERWKFIVRSDLEYSGKELELVERKEDTDQTAFLRVHYPKNSMSPLLARSTGKLKGGVIAWPTGGITPQDALTLRYDIRIPNGFSFGEGGVLPGLVGGTDALGILCIGLQWDKDGKLGAYGNFSDSFAAGGNRNMLWSTAALSADDKWHTLELKVILNTGNKSRANGSVKVSLDGKVVVGSDAILIRGNETLKLDGMYFHTFFGDGIAILKSAPSDSYLDFKNFQISAAKR